MGRWIACMVLVVAGMGCSGSGGGADEKGATPTSRTTLARSTTTEQPCEDNAGWTDEETASWFIRHSEEPVDGAVSASEAGVRLQSGFFADDPFPRPCQPITVQVSHFEATFHRDYSSPGETFSLLEEYLYDLTLIGTETVAYDGQGSAKQVPPPATPTDCTGIVTIAFVGSVPLADEDLPERLFDAGEIFPDGARDIVGWYDAPLNLDAC